jgi:hypothetical protein
MAENENRNLFALHGITGMLIATALLLGILAFLVTNAISVQQANAQNFYEIVDEKEIEMISYDTAKHRVNK